MTETTIASERGTDTEIETTKGESTERTREEWTDYESAGEAVLSVSDLNVYYGDEHALKDVSMDIPEQSVTALIGPSGCGKSTFLRSLNRMNDRIKSARVEGTVEFDGQDIYQDGADLVELRKRIGMVFQSPNPFPKSIRENVAYGPRKHGDINRGLTARLPGRDEKDAEDRLVERTLKQAARYYNKLIQGRRRQQGDLFWNAWRRRLQINDRLNQQTEVIPRRVRQLRMTVDENLGGDPYQSTLKGLADKHRAGG